MSRTRAQSAMAITAAIILSITIAHRSSAAPIPAIHSADTRAVLSLPSGRILAGTTSGLVLYDRSLQIQQTLSVRDGLPGNTILSLAMAPGSDDSCWVGTDRGIARVIIQSSMTVVHSIAAGPVRAILIADSTVFAGIFNRGVFRVTGEKLVPVPLANTERPERLRIASLANWNDQIIAGTAGDGLYWLKKNRFEPLDFTLPHSMVFALAAYNGKLYVGTIEGVFEIDGRQSRLLHSADTRVLRGTSTALWVGTYGNGILKQTGEKLSRFASHRDVGFVNDLDISNGRVQVAAHNGLHTIQIQTSRIVSAAASAIPSADISAVIQLKNRLWVGTFDHGLGYIDNYPDAPEWVSVANHRIDHRINALAGERTPDGERIWVGTDRGLTIVEITGHQISFRHVNRELGLPSDVIHAITRLSNGKVLVGTGRFAAILDADLNIEVLGPKNNLPQRAVWAVAEDAQQCHLLGTTVGLYRKCPNREYAKRYTVSTGHLADDWVTAIVTRDDDIFVGTYSHGVSQLNRASETAEDTYTATQLGGGYINPAGLYLNGNTLKAATMGGLLQRDIQLESTDTRWHIRRHAAPGTDVTTITAANNHLVIGSRNGLGYLRD